VEFVAMTDKKLRGSMNLTLQRTLILVFIVIALAMAGGTIFATLDQYRAADVAAPATP
jgi:hypothetical protein